MRLLSLICAVAISAPLYAQGDKDAPDKGADAKATYFPLAPGWKWTYEYPGGKFSMEITKTEKVGDHLSASRLETIKEGKTKLYEHVIKTEEGICRVSVQGHEAKPPVCFLKVVEEGGEKKWTFESKIADQDIKGEFTYEGEVDVEVPKGKYKAIKITSSTVDIAKQPVVISYYFAKDVGMVKQDIRVGGKLTEIKLADFTKP